MIDALVTGKLIRDPSTRTGPSGKPTTKFLLGVPVGDEAPVIVSGIAFADVAERIGRLKKGDALSVEGSLKPSIWTDKATGKERHVLNVTVSSCLTAYEVNMRRGGTKSLDDSSVTSPPDEKKVETKKGHFPRVPRGLQPYDPPVRPIPTNTDTASVKVEPVDDDEAQWYEPKARLLWRALKVKSKGDAVPDAIDGQAVRIDALAVPATQTQEPPND